MRILKGAVVALSVAVLALPAQAHEFFIEPLSYQVAPEAEIQANLRVGQEMSGTRQPYLPPTFRRFDLVMDGRAQPVRGRAGDRPAVQMVAPREGLAVIAHVTTDSRVNYSDWSDFESFLQHKDAAWVLDAHVARGLSTDRVVEQYSRYAKSLVAVGHGRGTDSEVGLRTEIIAEANPYTDSLSRGFPIQVLYEGAPRAQAQVEVFAKAPDGNVTITYQTTDAQGRVRVPVQAGYSYLLDAVILLPLESRRGRDPTWESLWASLTFAVPE